MMILTFLLLGFGIYYIMTNKDGQNIKFNNHKNPEEILRERYANGEIDDETFRTMKEVLKR
ncbi:MAG: hypothetical protein APF84_08935 [Gracilibacter sp. BRH_c7a]|nr:MAG: hypothetical protein APF84_08935 [Gracilibacter sp. BRH_c7a]